MTNTDIIQLLLYCPSTQVYLTKTSSSALSRLLSFLKWSVFKEPVFEVGE